LDQREGVPYVIYLLAGVVMMTFFSQAVLAVTGSMVNNADVLARVHVPAEVFSLAAATAAAVNFVLSLFPGVDGLSPGTEPRDDVPGVRVPPTQEANRAVAHSISESLEPRVRGMAPTVPLSR
jgi:hypothetical protein